MADTLDTIFARHSAHVVRADPIPRELVECLLAAAVQAPNHYLVRPWRFIVLQGAARERLGEIVAQALKEKRPDLPLAALEKERTKPLRAPLLIAVGVDLPQDPRVSLLENICAAAAAVENLLLAAQAIGLAGMWRTGTAVSEPQVKKFLGLSPEQPLIGLLYIGYPANEAGESSGEKTGSGVERPSFADRTTWME